MDYIRMAKLGPGYMCSGFVKGPEALRAVYDMPNVGVVMADYIYERPHAEPVDAPTQYYVADLMGATDAWGLGYNGTGITIGIADTGVDFGQTDISTSYATEGGIPTSFDPGGSALAITSWYGPRVMGYLYTDDYDFQMWRGDSGYALGAVSVYEFDVEDIYVGDPTYGVPNQQSAGFFRVGMSVQVASGMPTSRAFFVYLMTDDDGDDLYDTIYVDWETSWALTANYNEIDLMGMSEEWDFSDNLADAYDINNPVIAVDFDGDGVNDYSMGALCQTLDISAILNGDMVIGIEDDGSGFAVMNDPDGHGTWCAAAAAGKGIVEYEVFGNGTTYTLPGMAPGAEIMALKFFTFGDNYWVWLWGSGYHNTGPVYDPSHPYHYTDEWTYTGAHQCDIISNSWGAIRAPVPRGGGFIWSYDWLSWFCDFLSFHTGTLFMISNGNAGPSYGSGASPSATSALMVGASTSYHVYQPSYDNDSNWTPGQDQVTGFSSVGPMPGGAPKPNLLAVGDAAFSPGALHDAGGNGSLAFARWGGTSLSCPLAAGVVALVYEAGGTAINSSIAKCIVESTATDLGYPAFVQGAGRIDAFRAVHAAQGSLDDGTTDILIAQSPSAFAYYAALGTRWSGWRGFYMGIYADIGGVGLGWGDFDYPDGYFHPSYYGDLYDDSIYTGSLLPGDSSWELVQVSDLANTTTADSAAAYELVLLNESTATLTSTSSYTTFALEDNFDAAFMTQFLSAPFASVHLTYPKDNFDELLALTGQGNTVRFFDWNDTNGNTVIDLSGPTASGEVRRISADFSDSNNHWMRIGDPGAAFYEDAASKGPTIYYHDLGNEVFLWRTLDVVVTVRLYEKVALTDPVAVSVSQVGGSTFWNVTFDVDLAATPALYEAMIEWTSDGDVVALTPMGIRVDGDLGWGESLSWGNTDGRSYDNGATFGGIDSSVYGYQQSGEWRHYMLDISDTSHETYTPDYTSWCMVNVTWTDPDTIIDVYIYMMAYGAQRYFPAGAYTSNTEALGDGVWDAYPTWPGQNVLLFDYSWNLHTPSNPANDWDPDSGQDTSGFYSWNRTDLDPAYLNEWVIFNNTGSMAHRGYLGIALHTVSYGAMTAYENFTVSVSPINGTTIPSARPADPTVKMPLQVGWNGTEWNGYNGTIDIWYNGTLGAWTYWNGTHYTPSETGPAYAPAFGATHNVTLGALEGMWDHKPSGSIQVTNPVNQPLVSHSSWNGPQVTFEATFGQLAIPGFPSVQVRQTRLELLSGVDVNEFGTIDEPLFPGWFNDNPALIEAWVYADLLAGQEVNFQVEFGDWTGTPGLGTALSHQGDCDIFVWAPETPMTYGNSLTGPSTASGANPEIGTFIAPISGTYAIGIDYYDGDTPMGWICTLAARQSAGFTETGLTATVDTSFTSTNARYDVRALAITGTSLDFDPSLTGILVENVTITNFFPPTLTLTAPNVGDEFNWLNPVTISWTATDPNVATGEELLGFSVEVSNDTGATWKTVIFGTTQTSATWEPSSPFYGLPPGEDFLVRVNCTDGMYTVSETMTGTFKVVYEPLPPPPPYELITIIVVVVIVIIILLVTCLLKRRQTAAK
jgi:hypothetical protein